MKDQFCSFYTNSEDITFYMSSRLGIHDGDIILLGNRLFKFVEQ